MFWLGHVKCQNFLGMLLKESEILKNMREDLLFNA